MNKLTIKDISINKKNIIMRVDFNVPLNNDGSIADDSRIKAALESIKYILKQNASLILMSHLGRPKGKKDPKLSLSICAKRLSELLQLPITMAPDSIGPEVEKIAKQLLPGQVLLLENLRFYEAEEKPDKDPSFAQNLAKLADIYVDDAFGTAHRKHSSTYTICKYFPGKCLAGFLLEKEISYLDLCLKNPKKPFYAIIGGAKVSSKIGVISNLIDKVDEMFIGGGMSYTFFKAFGKKIGKSICEEDQLNTVKEIIKKCNDKNVKLNLPLDIITADKFENDANIQTISSDADIPEGWEGMDIGPQTIKQWSNKLQKAQTILWNGPLGVFELPKFFEGTKQIAQVIASIPATTIIGGGDSVAAINSLGLKDKFTHLSTGGGASLEYIEKGILPGIEVLSDK